MKIFIFCSTSYPNPFKISFQYTLTLNITHIYLRSICFIWHLHDCPLTKDQLLDNCSGCPIKEIILYATDIKDIKVPAVDTSYRSGLCKRQVSECITYLIVKVDFNELSKSTTVVVSHSFGITKCF